MNFKLYFFKNRKDSIDVQKVIEMFVSDPLCSVDIDEERVYILYKDNNIVNSAEYFIKKKSIVPNIHKLDAQFTSLNFHMEIPPLLPDFKVNQVLAKAATLARSFNIYVYCELFEDVMNFKQETIITAYNYYKEAYRQKCEGEAKNLISVNKKILNQMLAYDNEANALQEYYKDEGIKAPKLIYLISDREVFSAIDWNADERTIFPSFIDFIIYRCNGETRYLYSKEVLKEIDRFLIDLPGFMQGTKVIQEKTIKKVKKVMKKAKFSLIVKKLTSVKQTDLIDV